jgi:DNA-binding MarR family transcriptional regulator
MLTMTNLNRFRPPEDIRELNLLQELEKNPIVSQRDLSHKFGIALGVTNACLKRMARRGWIRITNMDHRRIGYYLTPKGLAEKTKLTLRLVSWTVQHYSTLKDIIGERLLEIQNKGIERIVFYGVSDEMEIAYVTLQGVKVQLAGIVEDEEKMGQKQKVFGFELKKVEQIGTLKPDAVIITSLVDQEKKVQRLRELVDSEKVKIFDISSS